MRTRDVRRSPIVIALLVTNALVFAAVVERVVYSAKSLPGIQLDNADVAGKDGAALRVAVEQLAQRVENRVFTASVGSVQLEFSANDVGYEVDIDRAINLVQRAGRSGNPIDAIAGMFLRRTRDDVVELPAQFQEKALDSTAQQWVTSANAKVQNANVSFATAPATPVAPISAPGLRFAETRARLAAALRDTDSSERIALTPVSITPAITMQHAENVAAEANALLNKTYQITSGTTNISLDGARLLPTLRTTSDNDILGLTIDRPSLLAVIDGRLNSEVSPPVDATFRIGADATIEVVASKDGRGPDINHIAREILAGKTLINAPVTTSHPVRDTAWAESLGITELVSSFTSHHACCAPRVTNIHKAAEYIDGAIIEPGEVFSLNDLVGARTAARGFVSAPVFYGEFTEDFGGGVSQLATTAFNAAFWGGFEIISHKPHSIYFDRYPMGREATVNYPALDLKWRNNSTHGVFVDASFSRTSITVTLYGDREGKRVRETTDGCSVGPIFDTRNAPRCVTVLDTFEIEEVEISCPVKNPADDPSAKCATLAAGERAAGAPGRTGYSVEYFRTITVDGKPPRVERFRWRYRMLPNVILIGDPDTEPTTTTSAPGSGSTTSSSAPPGSSSTTSSTGSTTTSAPPG